MVERRTREEVEANVETVERPEVQCPNCSQWYPEDNVVPVALGADLESLEDAEEGAVLCSQCSESVFDYTGESSGTIKNLTLTASDFVMRVTPSILLLGFAIFAFYAVTTVGVAMISGFSDSMATAFNVTADNTTTVTNGTDGGGTSPGGSLGIIASIVAGVYIFTMILGRSSE